MKEKDKRRKFGVSKGEVIGENGGQRQRDWTRRVNEEGGCSGVRSGSRGQVRNWSEECTTKRQRLLAPERPHSRSHRPLLQQFHDSEVSAG